MNPKTTTCAALALLATLAAAGRADAADSLLDAVKRQDAAAVRTMLARKTNVNAPLPDGATALHWAASRNDVAIAELLVKAGAKVNATNDYGVTPLSLAALNGSAPMVGLLLTAGADANLALPSGETPLMTAARTGNTDAVTALLDKGAQVGAAEPVAGQTALLWALSERHLAVARRLVERGASVQQASKAGFTPLMMAARFGQQDAAQYLLDKGAPINAVDNDGLDALMVAVLRGQTDMALYLLDKGADAKNDKAGYTALHWASGKWESGMTHDYPDATTEEWRYLNGVPSKKAELITALIAKGADVNAVMTKSPPRYGIHLFHMMPLQGATPFFLAALSADADTMKLLVSKGANPKVLNQNKSTALMVAAGLGRVPGDSLLTDEESVEAVKLCLDLGIDVNAVNASGETALHGAAYFGNPKVAQLLVERGANMSLKNRNGQTPLSISIGYNQNAMTLTRPAITAVLKKLGATE
ncbi:MAG: ankyrin repeat domain-containing protein [Vicinamibacterales bacterium]